MRRLKDDLGITLERTGEWDYWIGDGEIHFKLKNPPKNKFIDLDTFVIYCELRHEGEETPTYKVKLRLLYGNLSSYGRFLYYSDIKSVGDSIYNDVIDISNADSLNININQSEESEQNDEIVIEGFESETFQHLENVHIYYAYTTLQEFVHIEY